MTAYGFMVNGDRGVSTTGPRGQRVFG
jgi:hypothetical protein